MVNKICKLIAIFFMLMGVLFFAIAMMWLSDKQRRRLEDILEGVLFELQYGDEPANETIEDILFKDLVDLTKDDYEKGTNPDLTIECRMCGENTKRGKYYKRKEAESNDTPYLFICRDCYEELPDGRD